MSSDQKRIMMCIHLFKKKKGKEGRKGGRKERRKNGRNEGNTENL